MENYKEEIAKLQTQLDELKSKIETAQFEVGKWYKTDMGSIYYIDKIEEKLCYGYGIDNSGMHSEWNDYKEQCILNRLLTPATPKEVEDALIKEAVKRGFKLGAKTKGFETNIKAEISTITNGFILSHDLKELRVNVLSDWYNQRLIFNNGIWATPIKTKTIDEIASEIFHCSSLIRIKEILLENKETLNNL